MIPWGRNTIFSHVLAISVAGRPYRSTAWKLSQDTHGPPQCRACRHDRLAHLAPRNILKIFGVALSSYRPRSFDCLGQFCWVGSCDFVLYCSKKLCSRWTRGDFCWSRWSREGWRRTGLICASSMFVLAWRFADMFSNKKYSNDYGFTFASFTVTLVLKHNKKWKTSPPCKRGKTNWHDTKPLQIITEITTFTWHTCHNERERNDWK